MAVPPRCASKAHSMRLQSPRTAPPTTLPSIYFTSHLRTTSTHTPEHLNMQSLASVNSAFAGTGVVARAAARRAAAARVNVQASFFKTSTATKVRVEAVRRTPPRGGMAGALLCKPPRR